MDRRHLAKSLIESKAFVFWATVLASAVPLDLPLPTMSGDGLLYAALADRILEGDWHRILDSSRLLWTKAVFLSLVAAAKTVTPTEWPHLVVAMNVVFSAATATLVVSFVRRATGWPAAAWMALLFYAGSFDVIYQTRYIMADPLYMLFATAVFVLACEPVLDEEGRRPGAALPGCLLLAVLTRPPGVVLLGVVAITAGAFWPRADGTMPSAERKRWILMLVLVAMAAGAAVRTCVVHDPSRWPFDFVRPKIEEFAGRERELGEVVWGLPSTYREPPVSRADHLVLEAARFGRFFQVASGDFSFRHNLVNFLYFAPLYALALVAFVDALRMADRRRRALVSVLVLWIAGFAYYHALTILLWRYRVPVLPQFIILGALGLDALRRMIESRRAVTIRRI